MFFQGKNYWFCQYIKDIPTPISMWVKRAHKNTLQEAFSKAILVEKDMLFLKDNLDAQADYPSTSRRRKDNTPKPTTQTKDPFELDNMNKLLKNISNDMVDLKRTNIKNPTNNRGYVRPPFRDLINLLKNNIP